MKDRAYISLDVGGVRTPMTPDYTMGFFYDNGVLKPVLYHHGRRVTKEWTLNLWAHRDTDPNVNSNTAD